eukprot:760666-Hanusia_phi.AAC.1
MTEAEMILFAASPSGEASEAEESEEVSSAILTTLLTVLQEMHRRGDHGDRVPCKAADACEKKCQAAFCERIQRGEANLTL